MQPGAIRMELMQPGDSADTRMYQVGVNKWVYVKNKQMLLLGTMDTLFMSRHDKKSRYLYCFHFSIVSTNHIEAMH